MRRPPASTLGDAADGAAVPSAPQASGGAPPPLAGAKKSLGGVGPSKFGQFFLLWLARYLESYLDSIRPGEEEEAALRHALLGDHNHSNHTPPWLFGGGRA